MITISIGFTAYLLLLFWIFLSSDRAIYIKVFVSLAMVLLTTTLVLSIPSFQGYAIDSRPEEDAEIIGIKIKYPTDVDPGAIYVWVYDKTLSPWYLPFAYSNIRHDPRAYIVPYTPEAEKKYQKAGSAMKKGMKVIMKGTKHGSGKDHDGEIIDRSGPPIEMFNVMEEFKK